MRGARSLGGEPLIIIIRRSLTEPLCLKHTTTEPPHPLRRTHNDPGTATLHLFSEAVATAESRKIFVANILAFTAKWGFDG